MHEAVERPALIGGALQLLREVSSVHCREPFHIQPIILVVAIVAIHVHRHDVTVRRIGKAGVIDDQCEHDLARNRAEPHLESL